MLNILKELIELFKGQDLAKVMIYIRQILCNHEWTIDEKEFSNNDTKVSAICTKCLYHKTFSKFEETKEEP